MQAEEQKLAAASLEIPPQVDSDESKAKSNRGGKRAGAGRKPNLAKRLLRGFTRDAIAAAIQDGYRGGPGWPAKEQARENTHGGDGFPSRHADWLKILQPSSMPEKNRSNAAVPSV
jgi:hypothetical protein